MVRSAKKRSGATFAGREWIDGPEVIRIRHDENGAACPCCVGNTEEESDRERHEGAAKSVGEAVYGESQACTQGVRRCVRESVAGIMKSAAATGKTGMPVTGDGSDRVGYDRSKAAERNRRGVG